MTAPARRRRRRPVREGVVHHTELVQGSLEWYEARRGLLTASEMKLIVTPTLKAASNDKERAHLYELLAQRVVGYVEPTYESFDMMRGREDEIDAKALYAANYAPVEDCGFITNDRFGFKIGYSPDGLVGKSGQIEVKSRMHKLQVETILVHTAAETIPADYIIQVQTGLLVSEREWCDFISYSAGLPMATVRVFPDPVIQDAIVDVALDFELRLALKTLEFQTIMDSGARLLATQRRIEQEITPS